MRKLLLVLSIFSVASTAFAQHKIDKDYDWVMYDKYETANTKVTKSPDVILMGDSITEFWEIRDPEFFKEHPNILNRGISSQVTTQMLARFQNDVIELNPKVVVITAGTNDVAHNNGAIALPNIVKQIKSMCEIARFHGIVPIICSVPPCNKFFWMPQERPARTIIELNTLLKEYAVSAGIMYVDFHSAMAAEDGSMIEEYTFDGCHPSTAGYKVMEKVLLPHINSALDF